MPAPAATPPPRDSAQGGAPPPAGRRGVLDHLERLGNALPEPALLFCLLAAAVAVLSAVASAAGWTVQPVRPQVVEVPGGAPEVTLAPAGAPIAPRSLLSAEGVYWALSSMLRNFTTLPALGLIFASMLGIGLAEKFGFFGALMRALALKTPARLLSPVVVLIGANASVASDAGYIVLPPLAAALYGAMGRHPVAGLAAAFAGVAGGFGAGFFPTGGDGALAGFAQDAARIIDPGYTVTILHNLWFKAASVAAVTLAGWWVTDRVVEPRLLRAGGPAAVGSGPVGAADLALSPRERGALRAAVLAMAAVLAGFAALTFVPGMPLHGPGQPLLASGRALVQQPVVVAPAGAPVEAPPAGILAREPLVVAEAPGAPRLVESPGARWSHVIVPVIFLAFLVPGLVFGRRMGLVNSQKDVVEGLHHGIRALVPILVTAFFMAQFAAWFAYTHLDRMLAFAGGALLAQAHVPTPLLLSLFVVVVVLGDFAISGMLSKFGVLAPILIPMFMMVGVSPEATTAAYRIGDSVVNIVTPLNPYLLVVLAALQRHRQDAGLGSLISLMLPYSFALGVAWTVLLLGWTALGLDLGPAAPLRYLPPG